MGPSRSCWKGTYEKSLETYLMILVKVTGIPIVIYALGTVTKGLVQGLEDLEIREQVETIQTKTLLTSARILRRVLDI